MNKLQWFFVAGALCLSHEAQADDWHVLDLRDLGINYRNYAIVNDHARNLLIYPEYPKEGINVILNTTLFTYGYWDSTIESLTTGSKYQAIGLETRLGLNVTDNAQLGYWHHSQHNLDRNEMTIPKFPSEDALEFRIYLFKANEKQKGIF